MFKIISLPRNTIRYDAAIILSYLIFSIFFFYDAYYTVAGIAEGVLCSILFPLSLKRTKRENKSRRWKSLLYGCNFMIAFTCALKITELLTGSILTADALAVVLGGITLQSVYFIAASKISSRWKMKKRTKEEWLCGID